MALKDSVLNIVIKAKDLATRVISGANKSIKETAVDAENTDKSLKKLTSGFSEFERKVRNIQTKSKDPFKEVRSNSKKTEQAVYDLGKSVDRSGDAFNASRASLKKYKADQDKIASSADKASGGLGRLVTRLLALGGAVVGIRQVGRALTSMLGTGDKFEKLGVQLESIMGSISGGARATEWIKEFTTDTPLQLEQVTDVFTKLKSFGIDPMNGSLQSLVDQNAALGGSFEKLQGISIAVGQAWAKQKLQGEEILQLIERGVPVWEILNDVTGKSTAELQKMSAAGALGRDVIKQLVDEMGKRNTGAAAKNMTLLSGYISNLKDEWQLFLNEIAQSGALDYAKDQLKSLLETVREMKDNGELKALAQRFSDTFVAIAESIKSVGGFIKDHSATLGLLTKAYIALSLAKFAGQFKALGAAIFTTTTQTKGATAATLSLANAFRAIPYAVVISQLLGIADNVKKIILNNRELEKSLERQAAGNALNAEKLREVNEELGTNYKSLKEVNQAIDDGTIVWDDLLKRRKLATAALDSETQSLRDNIELEQAAAISKAALNDSYNSLLQKFEEVKSGGASVAESIKAIGEDARNQGAQGVEALSIALQNLALDGSATKDQIADGLGKFLQELDSDQYSAFGESLRAEFERVSNASDKTANRISFLKRLIEADLAEAARRAGVDLGKVFTGIDDDTGTAISALESLGAKLAELGTDSKQADDAIKAGLLNTLKTIDSTKEIDATKEAIKGMYEAGQISGQAYTEILRQISALQSEITAKTTETGNQQAEINEKVSTSTAKLIETQKQAGDAVQQTGSRLALYYRIVNSIVDSVKALGDASFNAFKQLQEVGRVSLGDTKSEFADLEKTLSDTDNDLRQIQHGMISAFSAASQAIFKTAKNAALITREFTEQKLRLDKLSAAYEQGDISAKGFLQRAQAMLKSSRLLGQENLSGLRNAITQAKNDMAALQSQTADTVANLRSELASLRGDQLAVLKIQNEQRVAELEAQLETARASGDRESISAAQEALRIAREIYNVKKSQYREEQEAANNAKAEAEQSKSKTNNSSTRSQSQAPTQTTIPVRTVKIELVGGQSVEVVEGDETALLDMLAQSGARTI